MIQNTSTWGFLFIFLPGEFWTFSLNKSGLLSTHKQFLELSLIIVYILVIWISFSGVSIIFRFDSFSLPMSIHHFLLVFYMPKKNFCVCFLHYQFILVSILLFCPQKEFLYFPIAFLVLLQFPLFILLYLKHFSCYSPTVVLISATTFLRLSASVSQNIHLLVPLRI